MPIIVNSPEPRFSGDIAGVVFTNGEARIDSAAGHEAALAYFRRRGYSVAEVEPEPVDEAPAVVEPDAPAEPALEPAPAEAAEAFDPADHNVVDVLAYLADADEDERARVLAAEEAGEARATILKKGAAS
ncbi:hypothetical protein [Streptomyces xanthophaeus]|uniref:hypothetical protein n=1 Tax=Streptomyces xanthophaeus TaxID=67385 RepID=UPI00264A40CA|nr:hypothetical protein [Streptomyces xanthophaeus]WKD36508.1 hypothetical protein KO717_34305 [Streptomyces xanthophaeus]